MSNKAFNKSHAIRASSSTSVPPAARSLDNLFAQLRTSLTPLVPPVDSKSLAIIDGIFHPLRSNLDRVVSKLTPVQMQAIPVMNESRDLIAISPTGSGKTIAYLLPLIHLAARSALESLRSPSTSLSPTSANSRGPVAVVLAPTVELCAQIHREAAKLVEGVRLPVSGRKGWREIKVCLLTTYGGGLFGALGKQTDRGDEGVATGDSDDDRSEDDDDDEDYEEDAESDTTNHEIELDGLRSQEMADMVDDGETSSSNESETSSQPKSAQSANAQRLISQLLLFDILVATPQRLLNVVSAASLPLLSTVRTLVLDEADRLLSLDDVHHNTVTSLVSLDEAGRPADEGASFLHQLDKVLEQCKDERLSKAVFSATVPSGVEEIARSVMGADLVTVRIGGGQGEASSALSVLPSIHQSLSFCSSESGKLLCFRQMLARGDIRPPCLIFVQSRQRADELAGELAVEGRSVGVATGDRSKKERESQVRLFRTGHLHLLICTDLLSRGLDFSAVRTVVNYDFPSTTAAYIHRIGRTGRAGREGWAYTFFTYEDAPYVKAVANVMKAMGQKVEEWMMKLDNPNKQVRKRVKERGVKRERIDTKPVTERRKEARKKEMIEASKRRKMERSGGKRKNLSQDT
ncbi:RNA-dependent ATPase rok1 [Gonapodya sp. JEL0774]|nr:RNA-dependent ATPase rok1 [Gonapodya sp. JEL0774]